MEEFFVQVVKLITDVLKIIEQTTDLLNGVNFKDSIMAEYLGYARYVFGGPLWMLFTTVLLIPLGVTIWIYILTGIDKIKTLLPW